MPHQHEGERRCGRVSMIASNILMTLGRSYTRRLLREALRGSFALGRTRG